ncbi:MAG: NfeD family protein [Clostridia bacterium]|nr:NfeD family protein [Clostridia bacterium]
MLKNFLGKDAIKTNAYSVIGKTGIVTKEINSNLGIGQVKIAGEVWSAKADEIIPVGEEIEVLEINGVKAVVKPIKVTATK